jgi:hypothetical protein
MQKLLSGFCKMNEGIELNQAQLMFGNLLWTGSIFSISSNDVRITDLDQSLFEANSTML